MVPVQFQGVPCLLERRPVNAFVRSSVSRCSSRSFNLRRISARRRSHWVCVSVGVVRQRTAPQPASIIAADSDRAVHASNFASPSRFVSMQSFADDQVSCVRNGSCFVGSRELRVAYCGTAQRVNMLSGLRLVVTVAVLATAVSGCYAAEPLSVGKNPVVGDPQAGEGGAIHQPGNPPPKGTPGVGNPSMRPDGPSTAPDLPRAGGRAPDPAITACPNDLPLPAICLVCADGSCGAAVCRGGQFVDYRCPKGKEPCVVGGCAGEVCTEPSGAEAMQAGCAYLPEFACYRTAHCTRQSSGQCGWTPTPEFDACIANARGYVDAGW